MEGLLNSRYTISVGAVDQNGLHASYSTTGSGALFISGPGGDFEFDTNNIVAKPGGGCGTAGPGTSFATPAVGGAIALVLQANPNLGWRDVQGILALTAKQTDPDSMSWITNAAGYHHSAFYGFGLMDTAAAVEAAKTWINYGPELQVSAESGVINMPIGDGPESATSLGLTLSASDFVTESVVVSLNVSHPARGNLQILLESPHGTLTQLIPTLRAEIQQDIMDWELMSVRSWGEDPSGEWNLTVIDWIPGNMAYNCVDKPFLWTIGDDQATCEVFVEDNICMDGMVNDTAVAMLVEIGIEVDSLADDESGVSFRDACCACGGGSKTGRLTPAESENSVVSWKLVAYGHAATPPTEVERSGP